MKRNQRLALLVLAASTIVGGAPHSEAQNTDLFTSMNSPTLDQTSDWLARVMPIYGGNTSASLDQTISNASIDNNCVLRWSSKNTAKSELFRNQQPGFEQPVSTLVPLGAGLDASSGLQNSFGLYTFKFVTKSNRPIIHSEGQGFKVDIKSTELLVSKAPTTVGAVPLNKMVPEISKAFFYAATLCQEKSGRGGVGATR
jgi:hypothetical protein